MSSTHYGSQAGEIADEGAAAEVEHNDRCCMEGAWPGWEPHPDCPGVEALDEVRRQDAVTAVTPMTPEMLCGPVDHDWQADPDRKGEGLWCTRCGVTEAELDAMQNGRYDADAPF